MFLEDSIFLITKTFKEIQIPFVLGYNNILWLNLFTIIIFLMFTSILIWFVAKMFGSEVNYMINKNVRTHNNDKYKQENHDNIKKIANNK